MKKLNKFNKFYNVIIINEDKSQTEMKFYDALDEAESRHLDLVQVNNINNPVICKFMNYGKMMYDLSKKEKSNKQKEVELKEVKVGPTIGEHDLIHKIKLINEFLEKKNRVKISMRLKGRMIQHRPIGQAVMKKIQGMVKGSLEKEINEERNISMIFVP